MKIKQCNFKQPMGQRKLQNRKYIEKNENENTTCQSLWDAVKAVLRGKFIATMTTLKKKKFQINNPTLQLDSFAIPKYIKHILPYYSAIPPLIYSYISQRSENWCS